MRTEFEIGASMKVFSWIEAMLNFKIITYTRTDNGVTNV